MEPKLCVPVPAVYPPAVDAAEYNVVVIALVLCRQNVFADNGVAVYNYVGRAYVRNGLSNPRAINVIICEDAPADNRIADKAGGNGYPGGTDGSLSLFVAKLPATILFMSPPPIVIATLSAENEVFSFPNSEAPANIPSIQ